MVAWIVSAGNGEIEFKDVNVPSAGNYDVTFWYFCGKKDNFGDTDCGKQTDPPTKNAGCRPHQFFVNATLLPGAYHFPCFDGPWNIVRAATVNFPLKAGVNTIKMHAPPPRDSVDMDAIQVFPLGSKGLPPLIGSRPDLLGH